MSEDQLRLEREKRWRESLMLLGIDSGPEPEPQPSAPQETRFEEVSEEPHAAEEPTVRSAEESLADEPPPWSRDVAEETVEPLPEVNEEEEAAHLVAEDDALEEELPESEETKRGRRRHRRGRGSRSRDTDSREPRSSRSRVAPTVLDEKTEPKETSAQEEASPEDEERPARRRRRRRRKKVTASEAPAESAELDLPDKAAEDDLEAGEEVEEEEEEAAVEREDEDDRDDILSDWNVPTWQELIASLYRPER